MGAKGSISAANTVAPDLCVQLYNLYTKDRIQECLPLHWKILRLVGTTIYTSSGLLGDVPARVHFAINAQGRRGDLPRRYFSGPTEQGKKEILEALSFAGKLAQTPVIPRGMSKRRQPR